MVKLVCISPLVFLSNIVISYTYEYNLYSYLFLQLMMTSFYYHSSYSPLSNIVDKLAIVSVVGYGSTIFIQKLCEISTMYEMCIAFQILSTFLYVNYLYIYGRYTGSYCFNRDVDTANKYHALLHCISSVGHILIVVL